MCQHLCELTGLKEARQHCRRCGKVHALIGHGFAIHRFAAVRLGTSHQEALEHQAGDAAFARGDACAHPEDHVTVGIAGGLDNCDALTREAYWVGA